MTDKNGNPAAAGMDLGEILYIIFRHKWKILVLSLLAVAAALSLPFVRPVAFQSEARLYIRYVVESQSPAQGAGGDSRIRSPDVQGDSIINTELQMLTSWNIAQQTASAVGPERILGKANVPAAAVNAAVVISKHLKAEVPKKSSVIVLTFEHRDPEVAQAVLKSLIGYYFKMHAEFHAVGAFDEFLVKETDQRRARVVQIEEELRTAKSKLGIISLDETRQSLATRISLQEQRLVDTEGDLAQERASLTEMAKTVPSASGVVTNAVGVTNLVQAVPQEKTDEYRKVCALVDSWSRREQEMLLTFTPSNSMVKYAQEQLVKQQQLKKELETAYPGLLATAAAQTAAQAGTPGADPRLALNAQIARVSGLESRVKLIREQLAEFRIRAGELTGAEGNITDLERRLQLEQTNYTRFAQSLEQSQIDEKLGAGKVSNISIIQEPSAPLPAPSKLVKIMAMVLLGGVGAAFSLAFLIELYLDPSIKRASDVEAKLRLPLFISIPLLARNGKLPALPGSGTPLLAEGDQGSGVRGQKSDTSAFAEPAQPLAAPKPGEGGSTLNSQLSLAPWDPRHGLHPFSDALRDRLMTYFEVNGMTHKPKLVAITSCGEGAGVSTIAAGLAASLSETGEGNVLLVDMNLQNGAAHHFRRGDLECGLDQALEGGKRDHALVQENLYVVSEGPNVEKLPRFLPTRFKSLVPKLKASDYDYIIFDMPPVSQVSITPRLSRFMDINLMVVESGQTDREVVKKASALLQEAQGTVGVVLNKGRSYVPRALKQEL